MKVSDYITVVFIAIFVTIIAYFTVNSLLGDPKDLSVKFDYLDSASDSLVMPNKEVFNASAINPTVEVYVGTCKDTNRNGRLDEDEKKDCGEDALETELNQTEADYLPENNGLSNAENEAINSREGYASGTTARQRQVVEDDTNEYRQNQNNSNNAGNDSARRETVSGS